MTIATVLTLVSDDSASGPALRTAVAIGRRFDAYVEALHVRAEPESVIPIIAEGVAAKTIDLLKEGASATADERAQRAHRMFQDLAVDEALPLTKVEAAPEPGRFSVAWREISGLESREVAERGRLFDLVVVAKPHNGYDGTSWTALEAALFQSGRPVVVASPNVPATLGNRILLAWYDAPEAVRSIWSALPFLAKAEQVTALTIGEIPSGPDSVELARALARHGIDAEARTVRKGKGSVGQQLLASADQNQSDLMVMGAYGHSRLQEFILGGATKHVLKNAELPVFMTH